MRYEKEDLKEVIWDIWAQIASNVRRVDKIKNEVELLRWTNTWAPTISPKKMKFEQNTLQDDITHLYSEIQHYQSMKSNLKTKVNNQLRAMKKKQALICVYRAQISSMKQECIALKQDTWQQQNRIEVLKTRGTKEAKWVEACESFINKCH